MRYINISERWGDRIEITPDDYRQQAEAAGWEIGQITADDDGITIDGERVAEAVTRFT